MDNSNFLDRIFQVLFAPQEKDQIPPSNVERLLEQFRAHDFFLNESQKVSGVGSWIWDIKTDRISWSDHLFKVYDIESDLFGTVNYQSYLKLIPANERDYIHASITEAYQQQRPFTFEHHIVTRNGEVRTLNCHGKVLVENGEVRAMIGTSQDVTEQRHLEDALRKQKEAADNSNAAKTRFLANMSHEIRTPIAAITGFAELLLDSTLEKEDREQFLSLIRANASWLSELIENVLDMSKVESGKIESETIKVDLVTFLMSVRELVTSDNPKIVPIEFRFRGKIPKGIDTDPTRLRQILLNIIRNAQKFTRTGRIIVRTQVKIKDGTKLCFDVCDTGIGMTDDQQKRVFEAFSQADSSTTRHFGGTGLGLTLSKKFARLLGGDVYIRRSRPGRGTIFRVEIPIGELNQEIHIDELPKRPIRQETENEFLIHKNILLVDDSADNREIIKRFLEKAGATVVMAANGEEALATLRRQQVDLILMDIQMPLMDGIQATREIRKFDLKTPIVALTAHALSEEKRLCLRSGFDDYLTKPVNRRVLLEHVSLELEAHQVH